ncbi:HAD family hydrolase [Allosphingosinicella sp.]|uniref:HAD family hydrolase n=1 Tax=Allosphingosinicella sp. TaxID=2823234 RepID=UPI0039C894AD
MLRSVQRLEGHSRLQCDPLSFVREVDQCLAELHHSGLRYPPRLLALGLTQALLGDRPDIVAKRVIRGRGGPRGDSPPYIDLEEQFLAALRITPALRLGVRSGLNMLAEARCTVMVVTEASRTAVNDRLVALGIAGMISRVIEAPKRPELYRRLRKLDRVAAGSFMIGDQLDRDIAPAKEAGLRTIFFAGGFVPRWSSSVDDIKPDYVVDDFEKAAELVIGGDETHRDASSYPRRRAAAQNLGA